MFAVQVPRSSCEDGYGDGLNFLRPSTTSSSASSRLLADGVLQLDSGGHGRRLDPSPPNACTEEGIVECPEGCISGCSNSDKTCRRNKKKVVIDGVKYTYVPCYDCGCCDAYYIGMCAFVG